MFTVVNGEAETVTGEPVTAVYSRGSGGVVVGAGGVIVREVSLAVAPAVQVPVVEDRVRVKGAELELIAVIVPIASAPPPTSTTESPTSIEARSVALVRVRVV